MKIESVLKRVREKSALRSRQQQFETQNSPLLSELKIEIPDEQNSGQPSLPEFLVQTIQIVKSQASGQKEQKLIFGSRSQSLQCATNNLQKGIRFSQITPQNAIPAVCLTTLNIDYRKSRQNKNQSVALTTMLSTRPSTSVRPKSSIRKLISPRQSNRKSCTGSSILTRLIKSPDFSSQFAMKRNIQTVNTLAVNYDPISMVAQYQWNKQQLEQPNTNQALESTKVVNYGSMHTSFLQELIDQQANMGSKNKNFEKINTKEILLKQQKFQSKSINQVNTPKQNAKKRLNSKILITNSINVQMLMNFRQQVHVKNREFITNLLVSSQEMNYMVRHIKALDVDVESQQIYNGYAQSLQKAQQSGYSLHQQRIEFIESLVLWLYYCEICFLENKATEALLSIKYCTKIAVRLPDHKIAFNLFNHQGKLYQFFLNYAGALRSFERMRDVAVDWQDQTYQMQAYIMISQVLQTMGEYKMAVVSCKCMLQIAWHLQCQKYEIKAYELLAKQHYYLSDLHKASYYLDRFMRGKFENLDSKVRELSMIQYQKKLEVNTLIDGNHDIQNNQYEQVSELVKKSGLQINKIQSRSRDGYFKVNGVNLTEIMLADENKKDQSPSNSQNKDLKKQDTLESKKDEFDKIKKILNLYSGHDLKFDRESNIKRVGTPINQIKGQDLPSPVAKKNSTNYRLLPCQIAPKEQSEQDAETQVKKMTFVSKDYLTQLKTASEDKALKRQKLLEQMASDTVSKIDMSDIIIKARINSRQKPSFDIKLTHLSETRSENEIKTAQVKLNLLYSFARMQQLLKDEMQKVCFKSEADMNLICLSKVLSRSQ